MNFTALRLTLTILLFLPTSVCAQTPFDSQFWKYWSDGKAEISSYQTSQPRYGESREGLAVAIFVTEPFSTTRRVKADPGNHPESEVTTVLKLNLVEDFPTGIYDYNLMTSSFLSLTDTADIKSGATLKVSFSSQEWCGHVYSQLLPNTDKASHVVHSYFDSEADAKTDVTFPENWVSEDLLLHWARGLTEPFLKPGQSATRPLVKSLKETRLLHRPLRHHEAKFTRGNELVKYQSSNGTEYLVRKLSVARDDGLRIDFSVENEFPNRIVHWKSSDGFTAELITSKRIAYWNENGNRSLKLLKELGLNARPKNTP